MSEATTRAPWRTLQAAATAMILVAAARLGHAQGVVVNEIYTGNPDFVEVMNLGPGSEDLGGWRLASSFGQSVYPDFVIPPGVTLAAGESVVFVESNASLGAAVAAPPPGTPLFNTGTPWGWVGHSTGAVALIDAGNACRDLVVFGTGPVAIPPGAVGGSFSQPLDRSFNDPALDDALYRTTNLDTDTGADWANGPDGAETPGLLNPGQVLGALDLVGIRLASGSGVLVFGGSSTVTVTGQIDAILTGGGLAIDAVGWDTLVGGTLALTTNSFGGDVATLSGMILSPTIVTLTTSDGSASMQILNAFQAAGLECELGGAAGATPLASRVFASVGPSTTTTVGAPSTAMSAIGARFAASSSVLFVRLETDGTRRLLAFEADWTPDPHPPLRMAMASLGSGALEVGVVGYVGAPLFNLFAVNSALAPGSGPLFGIELGPLQYAQANLPVGSDPFHVPGSAAHRYHFVAPPGAIPVGWHLDLVSIEIDAGTYRFTPSVRVAF